MLNLRVIAVSAPESVSGAKNPHALNSTDPASLYNACRLAAARTEDSNSAWAGSNWHGTREDRRKTCMLMHSMDEMPMFESQLLRDRPNLVLIGAMTICMRGAIECAKVAKRILGDETLVVLGGRHACETIFLEDRTLRIPSQVRHHLSSPLRQMSNGNIEPVFDLVIAGDGEYPIAELGELIGKASRPFCPRELLASLPTRDVRGDWIAGCIDESHRIHTVVSQGLPFYYEELPSPARAFGVSASFDIFDGRMTAHTYSDIGRGCVYNCAFCSEASKITGAPRDLAGSANRLYTQFAEAVSVVAEDYPARKASAFVEDSVLLGGSAQLLERLAARLEQSPLDLHWGAQLTIDLILARKEQLVRLRQSGLTYLFIGIETLVPSEIGGMSKDTRGKTQWLARIEQALAFLQAADIQCGCAILFGLGEPHSSRIMLLKELQQLRIRYGAPHPVSFNWAVQHPLLGYDNGCDYDYLDWPTPPGELLELFSHFGEASLRYPLPMAGQMRIEEVREVVAAMNLFAATPRKRVLVPLDTAIPLACY